jgi:hypothetical protein
MRLSLALVHHPVLDRDGGVVTTATTNLDLHDMARSARTYGVEALFVVHPIEAQRALAEKIREHWVTGSGRKRIPDRGTALEVLSVRDSLETVYAELGGRDAIEVWTTAASAKHGAITTFSDARARLDATDRPVVLLFGTGWGLAPEVIRGADVRIEPIVGAPGSTFNHLSVRAACAISLDRLRGPRG